MTSALVHTVPENLKRLIRYVLKSFYSFEMYLVMEMLLIYPCIKEEDLASVLKLEPKAIRLYLNSLKAEKFVSEKSTMESVASSTALSSMSDSAKQRQESMQKKSYFYINFKMMVNVIKYKLDKIRIQIEHEEKQTTSRASFKCTQCHRAYADADIIIIFQTMKCIYCSGGQVEEDASQAGNRTARNLLAKFNTQMELIYRLLHEVENIKLAPELLSPQPQDYSEIIARLNENSSADAGGSGAAGASSASLKNSGEKWSGEATRRIDYFGQTQINVNLESADAKNGLVNEISLMSEAASSPETPTSLLESLESCSKSNNTFSSIIGFKTPAAVANGETGSKSFQRVLSQSQLDKAAQQSGVGADAKNGSLDDLILKTLLIHENKQGGNGNAGAASSGAASVNGGATTQHLKKRDSNHLEYESSTASISYESKINESVEHSVPTKKRRLNGYYHEMDIENQLMDKVSHLSPQQQQQQQQQQQPKHNHHRASMAFHSYDNSMDVDDNEYNEYEMGGGSVGGGDEDDDYLVKIDNQLITIDKVTPHLIAKMNKQEKEAYIDKCRQLYMAMYEL